jgi:hypothetical protein
LIIFPGRVLLLLLLPNSVAFDPSLDDDVNDANGVQRWELDGRSHRNDQGSGEAEGGGKSTWREWRIKRVLKIAKRT